MYRARALYTCVSLSLHVARVYTCANDTQQVSPKYLDPAAAGWGGGT